MNRECVDFANTYSNNGIYEAFYAELGKPRQSRLLGLRARLVGLLRAVVAFLCAARVRRVARVGCVTVALLGAVGAAGALETGKLSPVACLLLAAGFLAVAYLALRPARRRAHAKDRAESRASSATATADEVRERLADAGCR
ncbi:MAG TPA: hypothetical protein DDW30_04995 [Clostridiales bacterium]|nr:hypothetical protein [Clostridiales bacterium]